MLTTRRARLNRPLFALGAISSGSPATWVSWVKVALGRGRRVAIRPLAANPGQ